MLTLRNYQNDGVQTLLKRKRTILADEMGLGKTAQIITATKFIPCADDEVWIIVAPKTLGRVWANEVIKWYPTAKVEILKGSKVNKGMQIQLTKAKYICTSYESLQSLLELLKTRKIKGFIFDEAHKLKSRTAKMHKAAAELNKAYPSAYLFFATGTPLMNRAEELWSLLHMIDPMQYSNFEHWANQHLKATETYIPGVGWKKQHDVPRYPEAFKDYVSTYILRRLKADVVELPEKTYVTHDVELEDEQLKHYETMRDMYYMEWSTSETEGGQITATAIIAAITRMKQLALSPDLIRDRDNPNYKTMPLRGAKIDALEELLEEAVSSGQKVVVFSQFAQAMIRLHHQFSKHYKCEVMTGDNTDLQRDAAIKNFQEGDSQVFFVGTQVGGVGITLTSASVAIFLDLMWTPAANSQAADRLHRIGQRNPVTIYYIKAVETIEDYILDILSKKEELFEMIMPEERFNELNTQLSSNWRSLLGK